MFELVKCMYVLNMFFAMKLSMQVHAGHLSEINMWGTFYPDVRVFVL